MQPSRQLYKWCACAKIELPVCVCDVSSYKVSSQVSLDHRAKDYTCLIYTWPGSMSQINDAEIHWLILDGLEVFGDSGWDQWSFTPFLHNPARKEHTSKTASVVDSDEVFLLRCEREHRNPEWNPIFFHMWLLQPMRIQFLKCEPSLKSHEDCIGILCDSCVPPHRHSSSLGTGKRGIVTIIVTTMLMQQQYF